MLSFGYDYLVGWLLVSVMFVEHLVPAKGMGLLFLVKKFKKTAPASRLHS
jgi:hypothetical protein